MNSVLVVKIILGLSLYFLADYLQDGAVDGSLIRSFPVFHFQAIPGMAKWGSGSLTKGKTSNPHRKRGSMKNLTRMVNTEDPSDNKTREQVEVQITLKGLQAERFLWYWRKKK